MKAYLTFYDMGIRCGLFWGKIKPPLARWKSVRLFWKKIVVLNRATPINYWRLFSFNWLAYPLIIYPMADHSGATFCSVCIHRILKNVVSGKHYPS